MRIRIERQYRGPALKRVVIAKDIKSIDEALVMREALKSDFGKAVVVIEIEDEKEIELCPSTPLNV